MASKKISQPIHVSSIATKKRWSVCTIASVLMQVTFLQLIAMLLMIMPSSSDAKLAEEKQIFVTNNHTNVLTVRCFTFYDKNPPYPGRFHLQPNQRFNFTVKPNAWFPSLSMYNCSTNMGVFIAYKFDYNCAQESVKSCDWKFDENRAYHFIHQTQTWEALDYNPNYESLGRGGVIKGYFTN